MTNRVSSYFPRSGHSATETEFNNMNTRKLKRQRNPVTIYDLVAKIGTNMYEILTDYTRLYYRAPAKIHT